MKKKLLSMVVAVAMVVSCVCEASAAFVDESATNGEGRIDNVLTTATVATVNEYDYIEQLEESTYEELGDLGITAQEAESIVSEFKHALSERASLSDDELKAYGYNNTEIEILHDYANGQELSAAQLRAVSSTCSGEIKCYSVTTKTAKFGYKWTWNRCPVLTLSDASAMRWIAYDSTESDIGVQQTSSSMKIDYYYKGNAAGEGGKMFDMNGTNEPNLDFNTLNMQFPVGLSHSSPSGIIFDCYAKTGEVTVSIKVPAKSEQSIRYIFVAGLYGHTLVGVGSPCVSYSNGAVGIAFTGQTNTDSIASRKATLSEGSNKVDYWG